MKFKVKVNRKTGVSLLYVEGDKDEELGYAEAETLRRGGLTALLPLTYERRGRIYRFTYAAQGLFPLSAAIAAPSSRGSSSACSCPSSTSCWNARTTGSCASA